LLVLNIRAACKVDASNQRWTWPEFALLMLQLDRLSAGIGNLFVPENVRHEIVNIMAALAPRLAPSQSMPALSSLMPDDAKTWIVSLDERQTYDVLFRQYAQGASILSGLFDFSCLV
jgi:hypothetical protein